MNNNIDYTTVIDCGLCHEEVTDTDRLEVQAKSGKTGAIFYWPAFLHKDCVYTRGSRRILDCHKDSYTYIARAKAKAAKAEQLKLGV
jgi:hypothetical protein